MIDLRREQEKKEAKAFMNTFKRSKKYTRKDMFKMLKYSFFGICAYAILFEPKWTGSLIGNWIHNFFVTMINEIVK